MAHHHGGNSGGRGEPPGLSSTYLTSLSSQSVPLIPSVSDGRLLTTVTSVNNSSNTLQNPVSSNQRTPGYYVPSNKDSPVWHNRYPPSVNFLTRPTPDVHSVRDLRTDRDQDLRDKRNDSKKATDQAVQQHFDESLRLAEQKRLSQSQWKPSKFDEDLHSNSRAHLLTTTGPTSSASAMDKQYYGAPPPLESSVKSMVDSKLSIFPKIDAGIPRAREVAPPVQRRDQDRPYFPPPSNHLKAGYNYASAPIPRAKVSSPAPPQIYGKPDARITAPPVVPSVRHFDPSDVVPLSLTSKGATIARDSPPVTSSDASLPQHEVRPDIASYYKMSSYPGPINYMSGNASPSTQTKPLDLGGKRKTEYESAVPPSLEPKKIKNEDPLDLKPAEAVMNLSTFGSDVKPLNVHLSESQSTHGSHSKVIGLSMAGPAVSALTAGIISPSVQLPAAPSHCGPYNYSMSPTVTAALISKPIALPASQPVVVSQSALLAAAANSSGSTSVTSQISTPAENLVPPIETNDSNSNTQESNNSISNSSSPSSTHKGGTVHKLKKHWLQRHSGEDGVSSGDSPLKNRSSSPAQTFKNTSSPTKSSAGYSKVASGCDSAKTPPPNSSTSNNGQMNFSSKGSGGKKSGGAKSRKTTEPRNFSPSTVTNSLSDSTRRDNMSSDSDEDNEKPPPKRKPPKVKRKNGKERKKNVSHTESESESEKETDSESSSTKGKDTLTSSQPSGQSTSLNNNKKRGRKAKEGNGTSPRGDRRKPNPFKRKSIHILKKTLESFLQDGSCNEVASKLGKCRECRYSSGTRSKKQSHPFCRFYAFRKLRYTKSGSLAIAGFSDPVSDATEEDKNLWLPAKENLPKCLEFEMSKTLISQIGDQFCELVREERDAMDLNMNAETKSAAAWKRVVPGVRDMCDVCETTLFNFHWACGKCGFVVCIACYKSRKNNSVKIYNDSGKERDKFQWLLCSNRQNHELDKLMLTQAIAGDSLNELGRLMHKMRSNWGIHQLCNCPEACKNESNSSKKQEQLVCESNGIRKNVNEKPGENCSTSSDDSDGDEDNHSTLRDLLSNSIRLSTSTDGKDTEKTKGTDQVAPGPSAVGRSEDGNLNVDRPNSLKHFVRSTSSNYHRQLLPIRVWMLSESTLLYPSLPHSWLCAGRLLRLEDPLHPLNVKLFQDMWKRGQPVLVGNVDTRLNKPLWTPEAFSKDFSELKSDLVNCISGKTLANQSIKKFWDGFDYVKKRLLDDKGNPMLLKLKDWPPGEDFAEVLPDRFKDLMAALPLTDYTDRNGRLNLAARLPNNFVKPDLGPKMYIAYGSGLHLDKGTTNLHLDISDAVNVMVHVGVPKDVDNTEHMNAVREAIRDSDCDTITIQKVIEKGEKAGALWHIYNSRDADKIRDLLNKVAMERGDPLEPNHDPIHDQSWYLDRPLRKRLMDEYDVSGYPIVQCLGDAVFIPAGAPHQVRNLNNCIKIAEDFVSPENVSHCFDLTEEFRRLSNTHQNHEDKLQIKNIIYHAVKDAVSVLMYGNGNGKATSEGLHEAPVLAHNSSSISSE